jgi:hypothetical protein
MNGWLLAFIFWLPLSGLSLIQELSVYLKKSEKKKVDDNYLRGIFNQANMWKKCFDSKVFLFFIPGGN